MDRDPDLIQLRFEAQQCYLHAIRADAPAEKVRLTQLGQRIEEQADFLARSRELRLVETGAGS